MGHAREVTELSDKQLRLPDGRLMGYAQYGDAGGRAVLAIHGTPGSRIMIRPADQFASQNGIRLIAPDRPGYGFSSSYPDTSFAQWVKDIALLLEALKIDRFWLFGVSGGGPFAIAIAALIPQRVIGLALISPVGIIDQEVRQVWSWRNKLFFSLLPRYQILAKPVFTIARLLITLGPDLFLKIFSLGLSRSDRLILSKRHHQEALLAAFCDGLRSGVIGMLEDLRLFANPWQLPLQKVDMPVFIWQGSRDLMVPKKAVFKLADSFRNVEIVRLPGQGHFWIFEHFEEVLTRLVAVLDKDGSSRQGLSR
ncbi:MAG: alpha/beta hydrolase [bacterium]|nr:alpha/beta hydrolase [bacterium]